MIDGVSGPVEKIIVSMEKLNKKADDLNKTMSKGNSASEKALSGNIDLQMLLNTKASFFNSTVNQGEKFIKNTGVALKSVQKKLQSINSIGKAFQVILSMGRTYAGALKENILGVIKKYLSLKSIGTFFNNVIRKSGFFIVGLGINLASAVKRFFSLQSIANGFNKIIQRGTALAQNIGRGIASSIQKSNNAVKAFGASLKGVVSLKNVGALMNVADSYTTSKQRIGAINKGNETDDSLQEKVFAAAERSRTSYASMVDIMGGMSLAAPKAFSSNDELLGFSELLQKSLQLGGGGGEEQQAGISVITQAMSKGQLQGDDFTTLMKTAPLLAEAISNFTGKSREELKTLAAEGAISADILKGAMFAGAGDINEKFADLPRTFGNLFTILKDRALQAFGPLMDTISNALKSDAFDKLLNGLTAGFQVLGSIASGVITFLMDNLDLVKSVLIALGVAAVIFGLQWMISWIAAAWPVLLIIGAIALILYALNMMGVSTEQIVGYVTGYFYALYASIYNQIASIYNRFAAFAEFFANVFNHPIYSVKKLFVDFVDGVLDKVMKVAEALDWVFGSSLASNIESLQSKMQDWLGEMPEGYIVTARMEEMSISDSFAKGYTKGSNFASGNSDTINKFDLNSMTGGFDFNSVGSIGKVGEVGKINDTVDISSEDLKTMRELAEMKSIQNFVSLTPTVSVQTGDIKNGHDIDTIISRIETVLTEQISSSAQGVYA